MVLRTLGVLGVPYLLIMLTIHGAAGAASAKARGPGPRTGGAAATGACARLQALARGQMPEPALEVAAHEEAERTGEVACYVPLILTRVARGQCAGAVKLAEHVVAQAQSEPLGHLALVVARQCTLSVDQAAQHRGVPVRCPALTDSTFHSLLRGTVLSAHPDARRIGAAVMLQLAHSCIDEGELLLALASVIGAKASTGLACPLEGYLSSMRTNEAGAVPMGLTGWQMLCDADAAVQQQRVDDPGELRARLHLFLTEARRRDRACLEQARWGCLLAARGLLLASGQLARQPAYGGLLIGDILEVARAGGLRHQRLQKDALVAFSFGPFQTRDALRSARERITLHELREHLVGERDRWEPGLLRLELAVVDLMSQRQPACDRSSGMASAIADFAAASQEAEMSVGWGEVLGLAARECTAAARQCSTAMEASHFCGAVAASLAAGVDPFRKYIDLPSQDLVIGGQR